MKRQGGDAFCKEAKWMSIGTVREKSGITVYKRHNATPDCTCLMDQMGNRLSRFLLYSSLLFLFLSFVACSLSSLPFHNEGAHATSVSLSRPKGKIHARNGRDEKSRRWRSKRSLRLLFTSERLFINTAVSKYRNGCQTFHSSTSIRLFFSFLLFFFFFLSSLIHCSSN